MSIWVNWHVVGKRQCRGPSNRVWSCSKGSEKTVLRHIIGRNEYFYSLVGTCYWVLPVSCLPLSNILYLTSLEFTENLELSIVPVNPLLVRRAIVESMDHLLSASMLESILQEQPNERTCINKSNEIQYNIIL